MNQFQVIGNPISHSLSPYFFSKIFKFLDIKAEYSIHEIKNNDLLLNFIKDARIHLRGFNVTLPYKKSICNLLDETSPTVKLTQSVNCVKILNSKLIGYNTDLYGFENLIKLNNVDFNQNNILILGNGGVAYTVIHSLIQNYQNDIYVWGRNKEKVFNLIDNIYPKCNRIKEYKNISNKPWIIINCLSFNIDKRTIHSILTHLPSSNIELIIDINYSKNSFADALESKNYKFISGEDMFISQALESLNIWFDNEYSNMISYNKIKKLVFNK